MTAIYSIIINASCGIAFSILLGAAVLEWYQQRRFQKMQRECLLNSESK